MRLSGTALKSDSKPFMMADDHRAARGGARPTAWHTFVLDGSRWRSQKDFYSALSDLLGGVERDCRSSAAFLESMVYYPQLNTQQPPYEIVITNSTDELREFLLEFSRGLAEARRDRLSSLRWGDDAEVVVTIA